MQKKTTSILLLFMAAVALFSCNGGENDRTLVTANNETITLEADEKPLDLKRADKFAVKKYEHYFNSLPGSQIPLNKMFQSRTCAFYYGIPLDGNVTMLYNAFKEKYQNNSIVADINQDATAARIFAKDSVNYILITLIKTKANNYLLGGAVSKDSAQMMRFFETNNLSTRVSK
jgi:hypothetical protein